MNQNNPFQGRSTPHKDNQNNQIIYPHSNGPYLDFNYQTSYEFHRYNNSSFYQRRFIRYESTTRRPVNRYEHLNKYRQWELTNQGKELNYKLDQNRSYKPVNNFKKANDEPEFIANSNQTVTENSDNPRCSNSSTIGGDESSSNLDKEFKFKIFSYNILAQYLLEDNIYLYDQIRDNFLKWNYRKKRLMAQIKRLNADICCFQEMEEDNFNHFFKYRLERQGYSYVYKKRSNELKKDGCLICYNTKKFELVREEKIELNVPNVDVLNRENVAIILLLRAKQETVFKESKNKYLCVATTHLLYNPKRGDCKLAQLILILANLDRIAFHGNKIVNGKLIPVYYPIIMCGDLNLTNESKLYEFITTAKLENYKKENIHSMSGQFQFSRNPKVLGENLLPESLGITDQSQFRSEIERRLGENSSLSESTFGADTLEHRFNFYSVYTHQNQNGLSEITTCMKNFRSSVDFIFYHSENNGYVNQITNDCKEEFKGSIRPLSRLKLFDCNAICNYCIPDKHYPSDHFMLAAEFILQ